MPSNVVAAVVAAGAASALLFWAALSGWLNAVPLAYMAQLPLFVVGLSFGWPAAAFAGGIGSAGLLVLGEFTFALVFAAMFAAPVAILCQRALRHRLAADGTVEWYSPGRIAGDATLLALAVAVGQMLLLASLGSGPEAALRARLDPGTATPNPQAEEVMQFVRTLAPILPGVAGALWLWVVMLNGVLAQWIVRRAGIAWRPSPRMADLELPGWTTGLFALAVIGSLLPGFSGLLGSNAVVVLLAAFTLAGLAIVHAAATRWSNPGLGLAAVYFASFMLGVPLLAIAAAGVIEPWTKLRLRLLGSAPRS